MDIKLEKELKDILVKVTIKYVDNLEKEDAEKKVDLIFSKVLQHFEKEFNELFEIKAD